MTEGDRRYAGSWPCHIGRACGACIHDRQYCYGGPLVSIAFIHGSISDVGRCVKKMVLQSRPACYGNDVQAEIVLGRGRWGTESLIRRFFSLFGKTAQKYGRCVDVFAVVEACFLGV
jgi:hypothetical protein